jgi:integral membrane protein (TIGR01906 family)
MPMKKWEIAAAALFVLCFPLLLLSTNLRFEVGSMRLYQYGLNKYHASEQMEEIKGVEIQDSELKKAARGLIDYFNNSRESPQIQVMQDGEESDLFSQEEVDHLKDVKGLIRLFYTIQWFTLAYVLVYIIAGFVMRRRAFLRQLTKVLILGGVFTWGLFAFLGIWAVIDFNSLFIKFHVVSFSNDLYFLDPADSLAIMFPDAFFRDAALFLAAGTLAEALILGGGAWFYQKKRLSET